MTNIQGLLDGQFTLGIEEEFQIVDAESRELRSYVSQLLEGGQGNSLLRERVLFGTDYPFITPDRWLADFDKLDIKPEVRPLILKQNAMRLLGLDGAAP